MARPPGHLDLLTRLGNELKLLWAQMDVYQELYLVEQDRRSALLDAAAPGYFKVMQASLIESILVRIFRLMDPARTGGGPFNCSFEALRRSLRREHLSSDQWVQVRRLKLWLRCLRKEWHTGHGHLGSLKRLRNKELAHNGHRRLARRPSDQLWLSLTQDEFDVARYLAGRLWDAYRQASRALRGCDVVEPKAISLSDRPSMLLKRLSAAAYLEQQMDGLPEDEQIQHQQILNVFHAERIGEDGLRSVFACVDGAMR